MDAKRSIPEERYKLEIFVKGKGLKNLDTFSKSDPYCKLLHTIQGEMEKDEGDTEWLKNNLDP
jgi:copine 1/2/3